MPNHLHAVASVPVDFALAWRWLEHDGVPFNARAGVLFLPGLPQPALKGVVDSFGCLARSIADGEEVGGLKLVANAVIVVVAAGEKRRQNPVAKAGCVHEPL